jgi:hypothetical protein
MDDVTRSKIMKLSIDLFEDNHGIEQITNSISELHQKEETALIKFVIESAIEMYASLATSVQKAGGSGWPVGKALKMTVIDLISHLSTNGVRFIFESESNRFVEAKNEKK